MLVVGCLVDACGRFDKNLPAGFYCGTTDPSAHVFPAGYHRFDEITGLKPEVHLFW